MFSERLEKKLGPFALAGISYTSPKRDNVNIGIRKQPSKFFITIKIAFALEFTAMADNLAYSRS